MTIRLHGIRSAVDRWAVRSPIRFRLARGAFWAVTGETAARAFALASGIAVARILGKGDFGRLGMLQSTLGLLGSVAGFGLGYTATKYVAELRNTDPARAGRIMNAVTLAALATGGAMALICLGGAPRIARVLVRPDAMVPLLRAASGMLLLSTLDGVPAATLAGFEAFGMIARRRLVVGLATPALMIPAVRFWGVPGAVGALTVLQGITLLLDSLAARAVSRERGIPVGWDWGVLREWRLLVRFSLPAAVSGLLVAPVSWGGNVMLANRADGFAELGLFGAADQWRGLVAFMPALLGTAMLPVLSETHSRGNREAYVRAVVLNVRLIRAAALPAAVFVCAFSGQIGGVFGTRFAGVEGVLALLAAGALFSIIASPYGTALAAAGAMWTGAALNALWGTLFLAASFCFIPRWGARGLAGAYLLSYACHLAWTLIVLNRSLAPGILRAEALPLAWSALAVGGALLPALLGASRGWAPVPVLAALGISLLEIRSFVTQGEGLPAGDAGQPGGFAEH